MAVLLVDYSWTHPTAKAIRAAGYAGALRYLSPDPTKNLTAAEASALHAEGLSIGLAWESTATRALQGSAAGAADASAANEQADALGYPPHCPIWFAVDTGTTWTAVAAYFNGVKSASVRPVKAYGDTSVVDGAAAAGFGTGHWQTEAWGGTKVSPEAGIYQRLTHTLPAIAGVPSDAYDEDVVVGAVTLWTSSTPPVPAPAPPPSIPGKKGNDVLVIRTATTGAAYFLCGGKLAPLTNEAAVEALQVAGVGVAEIPEPYFQPLINAFA